MPEAKLLVFIERIEKLNAKYQELSKYKDEQNIEELENNQINIGRFSDKIRVYGKDLLTKYTPKEETKRSPSKQPKESHPFDKLAEAIPASSLID